MDVGVKFDAGKVDMTMTTERFLLESAPRIRSMFSALRLIFRPMKKPGASSGAPGFSLSG